MNLRQPLAWLMFWKRGEADAKDMPRSIVMLTREPHTFSEEELTNAAERAWERKFEGIEDPMWFVGASKSLTMLKAGKYVVRLNQVDQPYSGDMQASARDLPREEQKRVWFEHQAWFSLDFWNDLSSAEIKLSDKEVYAALSKFAIQFGDDNCCAIYFPNKGWMLPNDGSAEDELRRLIKAFPIRSKATPATSIL